MKVQFQTIKNYLANTYTNQKRITDNNNDNNRKNVNLLDNANALYAKADVCNNTLETKFKDFINTNGRVTIDQYHSVASDKYSLLNKCIKEYYTSQHCTNLDPYGVALIANSIKKTLDVDNTDYRILSIGTSPAIISETMKAMGSDVVFVPFSNARSVHYKNEKDLEKIYKKNNNLQMLVKYLTAKNIDNKKNNIILDYAFTNKTILLAKDILETFLDISPNNITIFPMNLISSDMNMIDSPSNKILMQMCIDAEESCLSCVSNVPHFDISNKNKFNKNYLKSKKNESVDDFIEKVDNFSRPYARLFSICAIDEAMKL